MKTQDVTRKYGTSTRQFMSTPHRQRGAVIVFAAIGIFVLLAAAAFSLDSAHLLLNNTRVQNIVDITALSAAKTLQDSEGDKVEASSDAIATFYASADATGNLEISDAVAPADISIEYSAKLDPFIDGAASPRFVRVKIESLPLQPWFIQIFGINKSVTVSAVAGWNNIQVCEGLLPFMVCGCDSVADPTGCPGFFGYEIGNLHALKIGSDSCPSEVGPGNAQLLNLPGLQGAKDLSIAAAGGFDECLGENVKTKPGQTTQPLENGVNSRFVGASRPLDGDLYKADFRTDNPVGLNNKNPDNPVTLRELVCGDREIRWNGGTITTAAEIGVGGEFAHSDYTADYDVHNAAETWLPGEGRFKRRDVRIVIGDCANPISGSKEVPILNYGCFHLTQQIIDQSWKDPEDSGGGNNSYVIGEFFTGCPGEGVVTEEETGVNRIVLFKDVGSDDS